MTPLSAASADGCQGALGGPVLGLGLPGRRILSGSPWERACLEPGPPSRRLARPSGMCGALLTWRKGTMSLVKGIGQRDSSSFKEEGWRSVEMAERLPSRISSARAVLCPQVRAPTPDHACASEDPLGSRSSRPFAAPAPPHSWRSPQQVSPPLGTELGQRGAAGRTESPSLLYSLAVPV